MTKQEYEWYYTEKEDAIGQTLRVGDTVIFHTYGNEIRLGIILRMCKKKIKIGLKERPSWVYQKSKISIIKVDPNTGSTEKDNIDNTI